MDDDGTAIILVTGANKGLNAVDAAYTATDLNGNSGPQSLDEGTDAVVRLATLGPDGPTGGFFDRHGVVPR